jgi:hypothetical protein
VAGLLAYSPLYSPSRSVLPERWKDLHTVFSHPDDEVEYTVAGTAPDLNGIPFSSPQGLEPEETPLMYYFKEQFQAKSGLDKYQKKLSTLTRIFIRFIH